MKEGVVLVVDDKPELIVDARAELGEGPSWDQKMKLLYWVDIKGCAIHVFNPVDSSDRVIDVGQMVGAVVPTRTGRLLAAMEHGFFFVDSRSGQMEAIADPEEHKPDNRFNDGKCDEAGRFWAGTMAKGESRKTGSLYCLDRDLNIRQVISGVGTSNGLAWSPDGQTMYYIDTPTMKVMAYDFDLEQGTIQEPRVVVNFLEGEGYPDGMTSDREGMLWIAHWGGAQVSRWDPSTGKKIASIPLPASLVTSCVFGGEGMDELYITTARTGLKADELERRPHSGSLFRVRPGVQGMPTHYFG